MHTFNWSELKILFIPLNIWSYSPIVFSEMKKYMRPIIIFSRTHVHGLLMAYSTSSAPPIYNRVNEDSIRSTDKWSKHLTCGRCAKGFMWELIRYSVLTLWEWKFIHSLNFYSLVGAGCRSIHTRKLPDNYPVLTMVMVIYHYVERIWRILITTNFCITYTIIKK